MLKDLPHLEFLPVKNLIIHEWHDNQRTAPLVRRILESEIWRNPPIVAPLLDNSERFMVLDGANRFTALQEIGYHDILVQVIQPDSPGLRLQNWNQVIWEMDALRFKQKIASIPGAVLAPASLEDRPDLMGDCGLALVQMADGSVFSVCPESDELISRVGILNALVSSYKDQAHLDRTNATELSQLTSIYPELCGLVIFPNFKVADILRLASAGYMLPAGITRFLIAPRALHLNYPLAELAAAKPLEEKNTDLAKWVQNRIAKKGVRYYAEPTFLFDE